MSLWSSAALSLVVDPWESERLWFLCPKTKVPGEPRDQRDAASVVASPPSMAVALQQPMRAKNWRLEINERQTYHGYRDDLVRS